MEHHDEVKKVLEQFKADNPWKGKITDRKQKFQKAFDEIKKIYGRPNLKLVFEISDKISEWYNSGSSYYAPMDDTIVLRGRLSVLTFLHEIGHALYGHSEESAREYSQTLFKEVFPEQFARLRNPDGQGVMWVK